MVHGLEMLGRAGYSCFVRRRRCFAGCSGAHGLFQLHFLRCSISSSARRRARRYEDDERVLLRMSIFSLAPLVCR